MNIFDALEAAPVWNRRYGTQGKGGNVAKDTEEREREAMLVKGVRLPPSPFKRPEDMRDEDDEMWENGDTLP